MKAIGSLQGPLGGDHRRLPEAFMAFNEGIFVIRSSFLQASLPFVKHIYWYSPKKKQSKLIAEIQAQQVIAAVLPLLEPRILRADEPVGE
jgi:hypothetical protein